VVDDIVEKFEDAMPVVGFIRSTGSAPSVDLVRAFRSGLNEAGLAEGRNVTVEYHWADNRPDQLTALVSDLVRRNVAVLVANSEAAHTAKQATRIIPIVFVTGADPVAGGLVASINSTDALDGSL
jgi:putative ABC transport system substrate-binding protein